MKIMRKILPVLLCVALAIVAFPAVIHATDTAAESSANVYIDTEQTSAYVGDTITVTFSCNAVTLHTLTGGIRFDTTALECTSVTLAEANGNALLIENLTGTTDFRMVGVSAVDEANEAGQIGFYSIGTAEATFEGTLLFTATFEVLKADTIELVAYEDSYEGGNNEEVQTLTVTTTLRPVSVVAKGAIAYSVEGQVVTVTHSIACKVGYWSEADGKYIALTAVPNDDGSYSFTAPEGVTEVLLVVKGDVTGDGSLLTNDVSRLNASILKKTTLTAEAAFAGDVTGDGSLLTNDASRMNAVILKKTTLNW